MEIPAGSPAMGKRVADLQLPRGCVVVAVDRGAGDVVIPNGDTTLAAGDGIIAMIKREARADVRAALVGTATVAP
jgi:Trk K+ transport system NAD-binding subunit